MNCSSPHGYGLPPPALKGVRGTFHAQDGPGQDVFSHSGNRLSKVQKLAGEAGILLITKDIQPQGGDFTETKGLAKYPGDLR
jgi:hypothetical protein